MLSKEDEVLERVEKAVEALRAAGQRVRHITLARAVGVSRTTIKQYPRVVCFIEENTKMQAQIHENNIMLKVVEAMRVLEEDNRKLTNIAICKLLGIPSAN